jgi:hypothetical protein
MHTHSHPKITAPDQCYVDIPSTTDLSYIAIRNKPGRIVTQKRIFTVRYEGKQTTKTEQALIIKLNHFEHQLCNGDITFQSWLYHIRRLGFVIHLKCKV